MQTCSTDVFELVLVDVSDIPSAAVVSDFSERLRIKHLLAPNRGVAANRNVGACAAASPLLLFLDDDCVTTPGWMAAMLSTAEKNPGALIGGGIKNLHPENAVSCAGQVITEVVDSVCNGTAAGATFFPGLNFAVPRKTYLQLGGCDESYGRLAAEDREFMHRWRGKGFQMVAAPEAEVAHEHRCDYMSFVRQYFNYGRGAQLFHKNNRRRSASTLTNATGMHLKLPYYLRPAMSKLGIMMRLKVLMLLVIWELSNLAGFIWQSLQSRILVHCTSEN